MLLQFASRSARYAASASTRGASRGVSVPASKQPEFSKEVATQRALPATAWPTATNHVRSSAAAPRRLLHSSPGPVSTGFRDNDRAAQSTLSGTGAPPRLRVAVDVDEVLGRFVHTLNLFCKDHYAMEYAVEDYWIYEFAKIWKCSPERSNQIVHAFFKSPHFKDGIPVIPGAFDTLNRMGLFHDLVVVTSRQHVIQDATLEWIDQHYPSLFQEVYFGNHFALEGVSRQKSEICRSIGASVLIDDNPGYAVECAEAGINVLLYDWNHGYPWSKLEKSKMHPLITVVRDWQEVERAVEVITAAQVLR